MPYIELHCISNFSFLRGASHPEEMVERALALDYAGIAITDECSFAGSVRAHLRLRDLAKEDELAKKFQLIHGTEIQLFDGPKLLLLATTREGYGNLSELVSFARRQASKGSYKLSVDDLQTQSHLLAETLAVLLPQRHWRESFDIARIETEARWLAALMPESSWIACELTRGPNDDHVLASLREVSAQTGLKLVAAGDVHMTSRNRKKLHDVLTAVRMKTPLAQCGSLLMPNAERYLRPTYRLERIYPTDLLNETAAIAARCQFSFDELRYEYPDEIVPAGETLASYLRKATYDGAAIRYPTKDGIPPVIRETLEKELALIATLKYEPFFLTVYEIVLFARSKNILCQGRGSAANSAVCYCLGITDVDPAQTSLMFERFISKERNEPPDIDVDFEHERREEVMQHIYEKYGRHRAALTAALHTYRPKGAIRDIGKALGLSLDQVDRLSKTMAWWDGRIIKEERLIEAGFDPGNPVIVQLAELAQELVGFPRHLSQHSGGFVIAKDKLTRLVPIENAAMKDRTVIQWDKDDLDALGLLKVDVLALGMLSCIRSALDHMNGFYDGVYATPLARFQTRNATDTPSLGRIVFFDLKIWEHRRKVGLDTDAAASVAAKSSLGKEDIPKECAAVYDMLCKGDSLGVFQVESRAQMNMLPRLRPRCMYDLVIETAIVRPGPIQGGMVHPYLKRRQKLEPVSYPSLEVKEVLKRTLGVSIFQEQVMRLAVVAAGFTEGEADQLRRAMAAWKRKGGIGPFRDKLLDGLRKRGYTEEYGEQIYKQIAGFGEYGFPESHAASFGLLVYVSSWLKCHEPAAFCAALLDSQPLGFYSPAQIVRNAVDHGVEVRAIDVMSSDLKCRLDPSKADPKTPAVRLGFELVRSFPEEAALRVMSARADAPFANVEDLAHRAQLNRAEINALAAADALSALSGHRRNALWSTLGVDTEAPRSRPLAAQLAAEPVLDLVPPREGQDIVADYRHTGLTLRRHPLALLRPRLDAQNFMTAADVQRGRHRQLVRTAGLVTCRQHPATASGVTFVTLEDETGSVNVVVWQSMGEKYRTEMLRSTLLTVYGHLERLDTVGTPVVHVIAKRLVNHSVMLGELAVVSRNFH